MYLIFYKKIKIYYDKVCLIIDKFSKTSRKNKIILTVAIVFIIILTFYLTVFRAPSNFPVSRLIEIKKGMPLSEISIQLKKAGVIRSELLFESFVTTLSPDNGALSGDYFFPKPLSSWSVARKITKGEYGLTPVRITILEGSTIYDIAHSFQKKFPDFDSVEFLKIVEDKEGYLFPDTYLFLPNVQADQVAQQMEENFKQKIDSVKEQIIKFGKPLKDVITMASILEKEARTTKARRMISGILWNRIRIGMPLQVDAVFPYINGKNTYTLTLKDLKIDSPYNTYKYKGLPAGPISNPGLNAIEAAVNPTKTKNLYYLSDKKGNTYYSKTFDEHKRNRRLHLN